MIANAVGELDRLQRVIWCLGEELAAVLDGAGDGRLRMMMRRGANALHFLFGDKR